MEANIIDNIKRTDELLSLLCSYDKDIKDTKNSKEILKQNDSSSVQSNGKEYALKVRENKILESEKRIEGMYQGIKKRTWTLDKMKSNLDEKFRNVERRHEDLDRMKDEIDRKYEGIARRTQILDKRGEDLDRKHESIIKRTQNLHDWEYKLIEREKEINTKIRDLDNLKREYHNKLSNSRSEINIEEFNFKCSELSHRELRIKEAEIEIELKQKKIKEIMTSLGENVKILQKHNSELKSKLIEEKKSALLFTIDRGNLNTAEKRKLDNKDEIEKRQRSEGRLIDKIPEEGEIINL